MRKSLEKKMNISAPEKKKSKEVMVLGELGELHRQQQDDHERMPLWYNAAVMGVGIGGIGMGFSMKIGGGGH